MFHGKIEKMCNRNVMAMEIDFEADAFDEGRHLRDVIRGHKGFSSALWKRIKWNGEVWLNGTRIHNAKTVLHEGDRVRLVWDESSDIVPADIPLDILYEDDTLLVVNKGTGMIIHPTNAGIHDTLVNAVAGYFQKKGEESGIHPVYRLDRNTTGVVVCSLKGGTPEQCAAAAAMALGNLLGLVCDPVAGLVEVPCVKRNVVGAVNAVSCANMALAGVDYAIPCDEVIDAMGRVGSLLSPDLRETGQGGLAATPTGVKIAQRLAQEG